MRTRRAGQYDRRLQGVNPWRRTIDNLSERIKPVAEAIRGLADDNTVTFACVIYAYAEVDFNPEVFLSRSTVEPGESDHAVGRERRGGLDAEPVARRQIEYPRGFAQVNVSYDGEADEYQLVRGWDGARTAERAMRLLADAGVPFGVNVVLTRASFPSLARTLERAEELGAREAQLLRYKPAGRARGADYLAARLSSEQVRSLLPSIEAIARERSLSLRIDCALVPLLSASPLEPSLLARFGVLGCEAGRHLAAVRIDGLIAPCSFAAPSQSPIDSAFSSARSEGWEGDPVLAAYRSLPDVEPCRSCSIREVCRGGCRIVADHAGAPGPDPECPRVLAHRSAARSAAHPTPEPNDPR